MKKILKTNYNKQKKTKKNKENDKKSKKDGEKPLFFKKLIDNKNFCMINVLWQGSVWI
jgi:hypothetical protein